MQTTRSKWLSHNLDQDYHQSLTQNLTTDQTNQLNEKVTTEGGVSHRGQRLLPHRGQGLLTHRGQGLSNRLKSIIQTKPIPEPKPSNIILI
jgi:hypothetical protein